MKVGSSKRMTTSRSKRNWSRSYTKRRQAKAHVCDAIPFWENLPEDKEQKCELDKLRQIQELQQDKLAYMDKSTSRNSSINPRSRPGSS